MPTEVKICGLSDEESVDAALEAGADFVGFVLFPPSPRNVPLARAAALAERVRGEARIVALTVDGDDSLLRAIAETLRPDLLQLHGRETPARVDSIGTLVKLPLIKVIGVATRADLSAATAFRSDRLLLDAKPPRDATRPGGHGVTFDWSVLEGFRWPGPWFLSGGLKTKNVTVALEATRAPGVDVSSGVESAPGRKDPVRIRAFIKAVRAYDRAALRPAGGTDKERAA